LKASVIVCCYNSAPRLRETLLHLAQQEVTEGFNWEVVLVDNNSTDGTAEVAQSIWAEFGNTVPLRIVKEPNPGLSYARKKGVEESKGELLVFCDDDNWLDANFIRIACSIMKGNIDIGLLCGKNIPIANGAIPDWFEAVQEFYACGEIQRHSGDVTYRKAIWGAGMVGRRTIFIDLYTSTLKHLTSDRIGNQLNSGGDTELCYWHVLLGKKLWYDNQLKLYHFIPDERLNKAYLEKLELSLQKSTFELKSFYSIIFKSFRNISKKDILNIFLSVFFENKVYSRLKLGLYFKNNLLFNNYCALKELRKKYAYSINK
jgi:glycosyltransferase involved in cell wall biosynthesis